MAEQTSNIPIPDPSVLTTDLLRREVAALKEILTMRINAVEQANLKFSEGIERVPTQLDREIDKVTKLFSERFAGIVTQISERDVRTNSDKEAAKVSVAAALQASK